MLYSRGWFVECDRCGRQFDPPGGDEITDSHKVMEAASVAGWDTKDGDLCPDCVAEEPWKP